MTTRPKRRRATTGASLEPESLPPGARWVEDEGLIFATLDDLTTYRRAKGLPDRAPLSREDLALLECERSPAPLP